MFELFGDTKLREDAFEAVKAIQVETVSIINILVDKGILNPNELAKYREDARKMVKKVYVDLVNEDAIKDAKNADAK